MTSLLKWSLFKREREKMKIARKITIGSINGVRGGFKDIKETKRVMDIFGIARSYTTKTSENMGVSYAFEGEFVAVNQGGEEFRAPVSYLPEPAQSMLKSGIDSGGGSIEFAFRFFVEPDESLPMGYRFEMESLLEVKDSDAISALKGKVENLLEAPKSPKSQK